jgi:hypothetical protein
VEHYKEYLKKNGKKVLDDQEGSLTILSHDATHVIYGLDTSLEETLLATGNSQIQLGLV